MSGNKNRSSIIVSIFVLIIVGLFFYASTFSSEITFTSPISIFKPPQNISVLVVGDIMLDRNVRNKINQIGFDEFFKGVRNLIADADIAVGNLEGPITPYPSKTASLVSKELTFTFDPSLAPKLAELGFDIFGLANNHILNFGHEGLEMTRTYLRNAGIWYYGEPNNREELSVVMEKSGIKVGFVGFHEFSYINFHKIIAEIEKIRPDVDILIVSPHWGPEYKTTPSENMKEWAHSFIDHGADVVIGAHPHVVADTEEYNGKKIFYSLGNFVFDQYFSEETMTGLAVLMNIKENKEIEFNLINIRIDREGSRIY